MKIITNFSFVVLGSLSLVGCSYFDKGQGPELAGAPAAVDLTAREMQAEPLEPLKPLKTMISETSDGSIEYFPTDRPAVTDEARKSLNPGGAGDAIPVEAMPIVPVDAPKLLGNPSVEIFPLDEEMRWALPSISTPPAYEEPAMWDGAPHDGFEHKGGGRPAAIFFGRSSYALSERERELIADLARRRPGPGGVLVQGFASVESSIDDPIKRKIANLNMSMRRALSVASALIESGLPPEMITTAAYGEARPAATAEQSRRVEIYGL